MSISNYAEDLFLDQLPASMYVQLHTNANGNAGPGEDGTNNVAGNSTRNVFTVQGSSGSSRTNAGAITWSPCGTAETYAHVSVWDALTGGNCWFYGALSAQVTVAATDDFTIAAGDLSMSLD